MQYEIQILGCHWSNCNRILPECNLEYSEYLNKLENKISTIIQRYIAISGSFKIIVFAKDIKINQNYRTHNCACQNM